MAIVTYRITNNSPNVTATINYITLNTNTAQIQHYLNLTGWLPPFNSYTAFTGPTTIQSASSNYIANIGPLSKIYQASSGTNLQLNSNTGIMAGWTLNGTGYTDGQTVVATSGTVWVITNTGTNTNAVVSESILFTPPIPWLVVSNNTGILPGWVISGTGYTAGQTVVATSGTQWIRTSDFEDSTPSGTITFTSNQDTMLTLAPGASATFSMDYTNVTSAIGTYTSLINIYGTVGTAVVKKVNNFLSILPIGTTADPTSPYYIPQPPPPFDGGGNDGYSPPDCAPGQTVGAGGTCVNTGGFSPDGGVDASGAAGSDGIGTGPQ